MIIRSAIFYLYLSIWTLIFGIGCSPLLLLNNHHSFVACRFWAIISLWGLKKICGINYQVEGLENLPQTPCILASKHQSAFETIFYWTIIKKPAYILKRELIFLPVFGLYLLKLGMIYINRKAGLAALKQIIIESKKALANKATIIIFPEGTRTSPGTETKRYYPGISAIYENNEAVVVPVALNTGLFWPSKGFAMKSGTVKIKILKPINYGLGKQIFLEELQNSIESESIKLLG